MCVKYFIIVAIFLIAAIMSACSSSLTNSGIFFDKKGAQEELEAARHEFSKASLENDELKANYSRQIAQEDGYQHELRDIETRTAKFYEEVQSLKDYLRNKNQNRDNKRNEIEKLVRTGREIQLAQERIGRPPDKKVKQTLDWLETVL